MFETDESHHSRKNSNKTGRRQRPISASPESFQPGSPPTSAAIATSDLNSFLGGMPADVRPMARFSAKVSVKRKRTLEGAATDAGTSDCATPASERDLQRRPRVFRVEQPVVVDGASHESVPSLGEAAFDPSIPAVPTRPPRRRALPAVVTKFAVPSEATARFDDPRTDSNPPAPESAEALARQLRKVDDVLAQIREAQHFQLALARAATDGRRTFMTVSAEIARLREHAEQLRRKEAARAVKWIRSSIAHYGLTPEDLLATAASSCLR